MKLINRYHHPLDLLNETFSGLFSPQFGTSFESSLNPELDVTEDENKIEIKVDLPGVSKKDIQIAFKEGVLEITGEKTALNTETEKNVTWRERNFGKFTRSVQLPQNVKEESIKADYENGVLTVSIEKVEKPKAKSIPVE